MPENPNLKILESAVHYLGSLNDRVVFLGGCVSGLLLTDPAAPPLRVTRDVDAIVEVASLADYHRLHGILRKKGFTEDLSDRAPICRWKKEGLILDIMPTDPSILGFGNRWFSLAFSEAEPLSLPSGFQIHILTAPIFWQLN